MNIVELGERPDLLEEAVQFFWCRWGSETNREFYRDAMVHSMDPDVDLPKFYVLLKEDRMAGSYALLRNDLISRQDLHPWVACLYVVPGERGKGLGGFLLDDACKQAKKRGFSVVYLCTSLIGYYEKYGWIHYGTGYTLNGEQARIYAKNT